MAGKVFLIAAALFCFWAGICDASPSRKSLHEALRRSVRAADPKMDPAACIDNSQCSASSTICNDDPDLGAALCPAKCGACVCEDSLSTQGNCSALVPNICQGEFAATLCPKTCGICGVGATCFDHVTGITCADLADPCNDELGKVACPKYCGLCGTGTITTTAAAPPGACAAHPCLNNGVCSVSNNQFGFECACSALFTGTICESKIDACAAHPCLNNGVCSVSNNQFGFECACSAPYTGTICESKIETTTTTAVPQGACATHPCLNNGACSVSNNQYGFECACPSPYTGTICEKSTATTAATPITTTTGAPTGACATYPCLNNGVCSVSNNQFGFECACSAPYTGTICESKITPANTAATTAAAAGVTTQSPPATHCQNMLKDQNSLPCQKGEVIFLIEYSYKDSTNSIDHEGDFIKELVDGWRINDAGIRFGVVVYHDTVSEAIHITDHAGDPSALKDAITSLTRGLRPSGSADLAKALDYVRENSFKSARQDAIKVAIPIVHQMTNATKGNIVPAADRLKADCVSITGVAVGDSSIDYSLFHQAVSQPYKSFWSYHRSYDDLENAGKWVHYLYPGCHNNDSNNNNRRRNHHSN